MNTDVLYITQANQQWKFLPSKILYLNYFWERSKKKLQQISDFAYYIILMHLEKQLNNFSYREKDQSYGSISGPHIYIFQQVMQDPSWALEMLSTSPQISFKVAYFHGCRSNLCLTSPGSTCDPRDSCYELKKDFQWNTDCHRLESGSKLYENIKHANQKILM